MSFNSGPDTNQIKYDRQLRLWGDHGQHALECGRVCLIGANGLATEILKALVLPGLGSFTVIDHELVTEADCGSNFFVHSSMINQPRAQVTCDLLKKLNPDVRGNYVEKMSIDELLQNNTLDFSQFSVVVAANQSFATIKTLSRHLWTLKIPLIVARTYGFIGVIRLQTAEHRVIEAHPDDAIPDLRLDCPSKSFRDHCDSIDMKTISRDDHIHLPSLILLFKTLQLWQKETNRTDIPKNRQEKDSFKTILEKLSHHSSYDAEDHHRWSENFDEAKRTIPSRLVQTRIPSNIQNLFQDRSCLELTDQSDIFWFFIHALKLFSENEGHGLLPVRGEVPDMVANTNSYVKLVEIYKDQANRDCEIVQNYLTKLLQEHNRLSNMTTNEQTNLHELVRLFCKNASFLQIIRTSSIENEDESIVKQIQQNSLETSLEEGEPEFCWYIGLRLCDQFYTKFHRYPGQFSSSTTNVDAENQQFEQDLNELKQIGKEFHLQTNTSSTGAIRENILTELCRYGASELHSISAFIGGCCAQETIKLLTHQYVPINNLLIYNGIRQSTGVFQL